MRLMRTTRTLGLDPALPWPEVVRSQALWRYTAYLLMVGTCLLFYTWSQVDATETAIAIDLSQKQQVRLQTQNARLALELETQRGLIQLHSRAVALGLVADVPVVEVQ